MSNAYSCTKCEKSYVYLTSLHKHMHQIHQIPLTEPEYICQISDCGKKYGSRDALTAHTKKKHGQNEPKYICNLELAGACQKKFFTKSELRSHQIFAHKVGGQTLSCNLCDYTTQTISNLNRHLAQHSNAPIPLKIDNQLICTECDEKFKHAQSYQAHMSAKHEMGLIWKYCEECPDKFRKKSELEAHLITHDIGQNQCGICAEFRYSSIQWKGNRICKNCFKLTTGQNSPKALLMTKYLDEISELRPFLISGATRTYALSDRVVRIECINEEFDIFPNFNSDKKIIIIFWNPMGQPPIYKKLEALRELIFQIWHDPAPDPVYYMYCEPPKN